MHDYCRSQTPMMVPARRPDHDAELREQRHRFANDLQLIQSLLTLQMRRQMNADARAALTDTLNRVGVLVRARTRLAHDADLTLCEALDEVCAALAAGAQLRGITIVPRYAVRPDGLPADAVTMLAMIANELATNALKHAFDGRAGGTIWIGTAQARGAVAVSVEDDGVPFATGDGGAPVGADGGLGLALTTRLAQSIGAEVVLPRGGSKRFEVRLPTGRP